MEGNRKKVLYFMPDNPIYGKAGNITRCNQMLDYFSERADSLDVDFVSEKSWGRWDIESQQIFRQKYPTINLYVFNRKIDRSNFFAYLFKYKIPDFLSKLLFRHPIDFTTHILKSKVKKLYVQRQYDVVLLSYVHWGNLIDNIPYPTYKIIDTHDFITVQHALKKNQRPNVVGATLNAELSILKKFDEIWTYSMEEKYIFEQFTQRSVQLIPVAFPPKEFVSAVPMTYKYDVLYVASDNPHNVKSILWFCENVLPLLGDGISIAIVGRICEFVPDHAKLIKLGVVDRLDEVYQASKVVICPMLSGTGVKIKVLEALSYHKPVVTTTRGVDGLINKRQNGCIIGDTAEDFAKSIQMLLEDSAFYQKNVEEGYSYFKNNHSKADEIKLMDSVFLHGNNKNVLLSYTR